MKKLAVFLVLVLLGSLCKVSQANPIDLSTACRAAENFYKSVAPSYKFSQAQWVYTAERVSTETQRQVACFYVFNIDDGFVMMTADDRLIPVLGFSTESNFNAQQIPENLNFFLNEYADEIMAALASPYTQNEQTVAQWAQLQHQHYYLSKSPNEVVVGPLVTSKWAQWSPYNTYCPADAQATSSGGHALVGCGAIVVGQVMRYWGYPTTGTGSHSYSSSYGLLSVNFANATYDYENMPARLQANSAAEKIDAVATLLYHCGVAVNMNYGPQASWSNSNNIVAALTNYFAYPPTIHYLERNGYSTNLWLAKVKNELDSLAPFFYGGSGSQGGHVFVCDGYRDDDYFHINWGFGGSYDGYFTLSALSPGPYDFSSSQAIIVGIRGPQLPNVSVNDHKDFPISIYPNPVHDYVNLETSLEASVQIVDVNGQVLQHLGKGNGSRAVDVRGLSSGIYFVRFTTQNGTFTRKFVKN